MNRKIAAVIFAAALLITPALLAQDAEPATEAAEDLDLYGVAELLKESESIEDFEKRLNQESNEVNNLDLNSDDQVDYITVVEEVEGDTHVAILRVPLGERSSSNEPRMTRSQSRSSVTRRSTGPTTSSSQPRRARRHGRSTSPLPIVWRRFFAA
jgi:hypothetical protein